MPVYCHRGDKKPENTYISLKKKCIKLIVQRHILTVERVPLHKNVLSIWQRDAILFL